MGTGSFNVGELERTEKRQHFPLFRSFDAEPPRDRAAFEKVRRAERYYTQQLRRIASHIDGVVRTFGADSPEAINDMVSILNRYGEILRPWAETVARRLLLEVARRDATAWKRYTRAMGEELSLEIEQAPIGDTFRQLMETQVELITSLPLEAAQRVHEYASEGLYQGRRYPELSKMIMETGEVTKSRADLIARTETARASANFMQTRAQHIGSTHFIWRTARDRRVRSLHRELEGKAFRWDDPPVIGANGERGAPGTIYNCFPGDTKVVLDQGIARLYRTPYNGKLVSLTFTTGEVVRVTYNHPILTTRGFVAAGLLDDSYDIIRIFGDQSSVADSKNDEEVTTFDELFESLSVRGAERVAPIVSNFYGDMPDGEVDIIPIDCQLSNGVEPSACQQIRDFALADTGLDRTPEAGFQCLRHSADVLLRRFAECNQLISHIATATRDASLAETILDEGAGHTKGFGDSRGSSTTFVGGNDLVSRDLDSVVCGTSSLSYLDTHCAQTDADNVGVMAKSICDFFQAGAGPYSICRLVENVSTDFSGHVFTIESLTGLYSVGESRIQVKNCRCIAEPILVGLYDE